MAEENGLESGEVVKFYSILKMINESQDPVNMLNISARFNPNKKKVMRFELADDTAYKTEEKAIEAMKKLGEVACYIIQPVWVIA